VEGCLQKMTMLVKSSCGGSSFEPVRDGSGGRVSGKASRKMRQVGKMEKMVRITWEAAGRERSPA
jgi:hypothetical protein